jgi:hypothetical protein
LLRVLRLSDDADVFQETISQNDLNTLGEPSSNFDIMWAERNPDNLVGLNTRYGQYKLGLSVVGAFNDKVNVARLKANKPPRAEDDALDQPAINEA